MFAHHGKKTRQKSRKVTKDGNAMSVVLPAVRQVEYARGILRRLTGDPGENRELAVFNLEKAIQDYEVRRYVFCCLSKQRMFLKLRSDAVRTVRLATSVTAPTDSEDSCHLCSLLD